MSRYRAASHSLMVLMGFPMRYPRFFIVCFVALGLAVSPAVGARADHADARSGEPVYAGSVFGIADRTVFGGDPVRRSGAVEVLADARNLESDEAGALLDVVAALILAVADAGQRTGVLAIPEVNQLIADVLQPPPSIEVSPEDDVLSDSWSEVGSRTPTLEAAAAVASVGRAVLRRGTGRRGPLNHRVRVEWRSVHHQFAEQRRRPVSVHQRHVGACLGAGRIRRCFSA